MLQDRDAMATVAVKDIQAARKFYEGTLGLKKLDGPEPSVAATRRERPRCWCTSPSTRGPTRGPPSPGRSGAGWRTWCAT